MNTVPNVCAQQKRQALGNGTAEQWDERIDDLVWFIDNIWIFIFYKKQHIRLSGYFYHQNWNWHLVTSLSLNMSARKQVESCKLGFSSSLTQNCLMLWLYETSRKTHCFIPGKWAIWEKSPGRFIHAAAVMLTCGDSKYYNQEWQSKSFE